MNLWHLLGWGTTTEPSISRRGFLGLTAITLAGLLAAPEALARTVKSTVKSKSTSHTSKAKTKTSLLRKKSAKSLDTPRLARKRVPVQATFAPPRATAGATTPTSMRQGLFDSPPGAVGGPNPFYIRRGLGERRVSLHNVHTGESLNRVYWANNRYVEETLREINFLMRDHHSGAVTRIDPGLIDILYQINSRVGNNLPYEVLSGYRTAATNALKAERSRAVARRSLHIQGRAVDIRLPRTSLSSLRLAAVGLQQGGVGYYPRSGFIHVDTGDVRYW